jgi:beta-N-acetylhexosaminidase
MSENPYAIIAIDEEVGDVTRLFAATGAPFPGNAVLGRLDDLDTTYDTAAAIGWSLREAGCTVDFAPCVDVNSQSDNPVIGVRSFGSDAEHVAQHGAAWVSGLQSTGVAATAKHFPGHGDTFQDSHVSLPVVDRSLDELRSRELLPFVAAIDTGCQLVMTSHILLPQLDDSQPATMSRVLLHDLLRGELGFSGVIVSDALDMAGASGSQGMTAAGVAALRAGCDLLCLGTNNTDAQLADIEQAVSNAIVEGTLSEDRVSDAVSRVRGLGVDLQAARAVAGSPPDSVFGWAGREAQLANTFDVQPEAVRWRARTAGRYSVVRLEADPNSAVGRTPWGPGKSMYSISPEQLTLPSFGRNESVLVVGRDIHRHRFATKAVDRLRASDADVLVVDMGWPSDDRRYADVATFGASLLMGHVLLKWLSP